MRKHVFFITALMAIFLLSACSSSKPQNDSDIPDFVLNPPTEKGSLFGTGIADQQSSQLAKETADLRAKKEIAKVLSQKVSNLMKDFMSQIGMGEHPETTEYVQSITKSVTDMELNGVQIVRRDYIKGKMYSLAKFSFDNQAMEMIQKMAEQKMASKNALLSEFRAKKGFEELNAELEKLRNE